MTVQIITGRRGSGKTYSMLAAIKEKIKDQPLGPPIIFIAPKQSTFELEEQFARDPEIKGSMRASIYGFDRLAWRIMSEEGGLAEDMISTAGVEMMTHLTMKAMQEELQLFKTATKYYGFSQKITETIKEFKKYNVSPEALQELSTLSSLPVRSQHKLHDIAVIYQQLEEKLSGHYVQSEDIMQFLYRLIPSSKTIATADIYIDGFHNFTTLEYLVIQQLAQNAKSLTISLTVDLQKDNDTFRKTSETYRLLNEAFHQVQVPVSYLQLAAAKRFRAPALEALEQQFDAMQPVESMSDGITLNETGNTRTEVESIVRDIHRKIRTSPYHYADVAILYRDNSYVPLFEDMLKQYDIPYYTDVAEPMSHHPAIELIRSLLDFIEQPYINDYLFRALKTGLLSRRFSIENDQLLVDLIENVTIERGLSFNRWSEDDKFLFDESKPYTQDDWEKMNAFRIYLIKLLEGFVEQMKSAVHAREFSEILYQFMLEIKLPEYLMAEKDRLTQQGKNQQALQSEQVYEGIIQVMDDFVEMMDEEPLNFSLLKEMFDVGLASLEFSMIPQSLDEVQLLNMDLARVENLPLIYICGFNEGILPRVNRDNTLITDEDKQLIETYSDLKLAPTSTALTMDESFVCYQALTNATDEVHIYYSLMSESGEARQVSSYTTQLKAIFPQLVTSYPDEVVSPKDRIETVNASIPDVIEHLYDPLWQGVVGWMKEQPQFNKIYEQRHYRNKTVQLTASHAAAIYGQEIKASVSRFENYNSCPFKHFAQHGLKLNERQPFEFQNFELGNIFHHALKLISEEIKDSIYSMKSEDIENYVKVTLEKLVPKVHYQVLFSKSYYQFIVGQITKILTETLTAIQFHQTRSAFKMKKFEQNFSAETKKDGHFQVMKLATSSGIPISIRGQIDRIDLLEEEDKAYVSIIDYKSSAHALNLTEVYYGKQMQMLTYMDVALQNKSQLTRKDELLPAAMLYFHVKSPFINYNNQSEASEHLKKILEAYRLEGFILNDLAVANKLDTALAPSVKSPIIPAKLKKDASFDANSKVLSEQEITQLIQVNRRNFTTTAEHIMDGHTEVAPLEFNKKLPCEYCSFRSTCHIDPLINGEDIRRVDENINIKEKLKEEFDAR